MQADYSTPTVSPQPAHEHVCHALGGTKATNDLFHILMIISNIRVSALYNHKASTTQS
jgi:hypothetical protein